ncbi:MAG: DUF4340 domain-containing protein [bacterium]
MSKRWLINYLLFFLVILFTWIGMQKPGVETKNKPVITQLSEKQINTISIYRYGKELIIQRNQDHWVLKDSKWPVDTQHVKRLLSLAHTEASSSLPKQEIDLDTIGLSDKHTQVVFNQTQIQFGDQNQIGNRRYVLAGPMVYLIPDNHLALLSVSVSDWVSKTLIPNSMTLDSLDLGDFRIIKNEKGSWESSITPEDHDTATQIIQNWQQMRALRVELYDSAVTPLKKIKAILKNGNTLEWYLLSIKDEIIIARPDLNIQYRFPKRAYNQLLSQQSPSETE